MGPSPARTVGWAVLYVSKWWALFSSKELHNYTNQERREGLRCTDSPLSLWEEFSAHLNFPWCMCNLLQGGGGSSKCEDGSAFG